MRILLNGPHDAQPGGFRFGYAGRPTNQTHRCDMASTGHNPKELGRTPILLPRVSSHDRPPRSVMVELPTKCQFSCHQRQQALPWLTGRLMRREPDVEAPALAIAPSSFAPPPTEERGGSDDGYAAPPSHRAAAPPCRTPVRHQSAEARTTARPATGRLAGGPLGLGAPGVLRREVRSQNKLHCDSTAARHVVITRCVCCAARAARRIYLIVARRAAMVAARRLSVACGLTSANRSRKKNSTYRLVAGGARASATRRNTSYYRNQ